MRVRETVDRKNYFVLKRDRERQTERKSISGEIFVVNKMREREGGREKADQEK